MEWFQFMLFVLACPMFSTKIHIFVVPFNAVDPEVARDRDHTENSFSSPWERGG